MRFDFRSLPCWKSAARRLSAAIACGVAAVWLALAIAPAPAAALPVSDPTAPPLMAPLVASVFGQWFAGQRPDDLGAADGKLKPCPSSPNCVSSQAAPDDKTHAIAPLTYDPAAESDAAALARLADVVAGFDNATLVRQEPDYLYAEFSTPLMGFVDDVEFVLAPDGGRIDARSASRLGEGDLGVNRQRIEAIRDRFNG